MAESAPDKRQLRTLLRHKRRELEPLSQRLAAQQICTLSQTLHEWVNASHVAVYWPTDGEVDTTEISQACRTQGKTLYLPVVGDHKTLNFAQWTRSGNLSNNRFGIPEPIPTAPRCTPADLDIIFLPLVGWDQRGSRLGMGAGYYDQALKGVSGPLLVGLGYTVQEVSHIPTDSWDIALDKVITEQGVQHCRARQ
ncbi:MAG: 5-formyltetrahydrofolate cyclo-ligase [Halioglobus sp.]